MVLQKCSKISVSYTHLAVELYRIGQKIVGKAPAVLANLLEIRVIGVIAVSYTHLDVYKRQMSQFKLVSPFQPMGDQVQAIQELVDCLKAGKKEQVLLGGTGTGKTFTVANVCLLYTSTHG